MFTNQIRRYRNVFYIQMYVYLPKKLPILKPQTRDNVVVYIWITARVNYHDIEISFGYLKYSLVYEILINGIISCKSMNKFEIMTFENNPFLRLSFILFVVFKRVSFQNTYAISRKQYF